MNKTLAFIIAVLATFRLTQFIVEDDAPYNISNRFRFWTAQNAHKSIHYETLADAVRCKYCTSVWVALLVLVLPKKVKLWLGVAGGVSLIETIIDKFSGSE